MVSVVTSVLSAPLSVFNSGVASETVTDSAREPTSRATSIRSVVATGSVRYCRTKVLKPSTVIHFVSARRRLRKRVVSCCHTRRFKGGARFQLSGLDTRTRNYGQRRIGNGPFNRAAIALGNRRRGSQQSTYNNGRLPHKNPPPGFKKSERLTAERDRVYNNGILKLFRNKQE
jgi:hypothetical protein